MFIPEKIPNSTVWLFSDVHGHRLDPVGVDVGEQDFDSLLNDVDELVDALPAALALPVSLVQEQRLEESLPQPHAGQNRHGLLRKPADDAQTHAQTEECASKPDLTEKTAIMFQIHFWLNSVVFFSTSVKSFKSLDSNCPSFVSLGDVSISPRWKMCTIFGEVSIAIEKTPSKWWKWSFCPILGGFKVNSVDSADSLRQYGETWESCYIPLQLSFQLLKWIINIGKPEWNICWRCSTSAWILKLRIGLITTFWLYSYSLVVPHSAPFHVASAAKQTGFLQFQHDRTIPKYNKWNSIVTVLWETSIEEVKSTIFQPASVPLGAFLSFLCKLLAWARCVWHRLLFVCQGWE